MNLLQNFVYSFGLNLTPLDNRGLNQTYPNEHGLSWNNNFNRSDHISDQLTSLPQACSLGEDSLSNSGVDSSSEKSPALSSINTSPNTSENKDKFFPLIENKRIRNMFTASQIEILEKVFEQTHYPDSSIREQLSSRFNLSSMRIQVWFQNRRAKYRKMDIDPKKYNFNNKKFKNSNILEKIPEKTPKISDALITEISSNQKLNAELNQKYSFQSSFDLQMANQQFTTVIPHLPSSHHYSTFNYPSYTFPNQSTQNYTFLQNTENFESKF
ncbi:unnamed protein product [Brachionus calyciflorus]|uniref:Homeobox domain-containing protein n=1 Tax=Brachionus calyciflorus TaxID=104777 RepID=A0A813M862_9BILA|nr:unnamed protein product [Brachionus calyciflorus]